MSNSAERDLRNALLLVLADGAVDEAEKQFVNELRQRLGIRDPEYRKIVASVRDKSESFSLPRSPTEAAAAIRLLVGAALADRTVVDSERQLLYRLARHVDLAETDVDGMFDELVAAEQSREDEATALLETIYQHFGEWDDATRRAKLAETDAFGRAAAGPMLRLLESYRHPDGMGDALELKALAAEHLGRTADVRAVYYLALQVNLGDGEDDMTCTALRSAAAEAIGQIIGRDFSRDQAGIDAARQWWDDEGRTRFNKLTI